jgi:excisionase family DNA binding protein
MDACELAHVSRRTIYNWLSKRKVEYIRTAGGAVRIYLDTLFREGNGQCGEGQNIREVSSRDKTQQTRSNRKGLDHGAENQRVSQ